MAQIIPLTLPLEQYEPSPKDAERFAAETTLGMIAPNDPLLDNTSVAVNPPDIASPRIQNLIQRLYDAASGQRSQAHKDQKRRILVGIAAPQIGELSRVIVVDTQIDPERKNPGKLECFINPEITWSSAETDEGREGCFSTGLVYGLVTRPSVIDIRALTPEGKVVERRFDGFTARIFQHEYDHLEGVRFPDRITSDSKRHWVHTEELDLYREHHINWPRTCSAARWQAYKAAGE